MKRIPQLDGIRGLAILLVLVFHYIPCQIEAAPGTFLNYLDRALNQCWSGVDLFFVLSGFLIAGILLDNRGATNFFRVFYIRRAARILPLYFLLLFGFIFVSASDYLADPAFKWLLHHPMPLWSYATFTQNLFMGLRGEFGAHWLGVTWALAVEAQFYLAIPLLIWFLPRRAAFGLFFLAVLLAPLLRCATPSFAAFVNTPWRADSLLSGACLAILVRSPRFMALVEENKRFLGAIFLVFLAGAAVLAYNPRDFAAFNHFWLAGLFALFLLLSLVHADGPLGAALSHPLLVWFGTLSYGIYMFHQAVSGLVHGYFRGAEPAMHSLSDIAVTCLALLGTLGLAALSHRFFEGPILKWGHQFRFHRHPMPEHHAPLALTSKPVSDASSFAMHDRCQPCSPRLSSPHDP